MGGLLSASACAFICVSSSSVQKHGYALPSCTSLRSTALQCSTDIDLEYVVKEPFMTHRSTLCQWHAMIRCAASPARLSLREHRAPRASFGKVQDPIIRSRRAAAQGSRAPLATCLQVSSKVCLPIYMLLVDLFPLRLPVWPVLASNIRPCMLWQMLWPHMQVCRY